MIATIYILFLIFGMAACLTAIVCSLNDWLDDRHVSPQGEDDWDTWDSYLPDLPVDGFDWDRDLPDLPDREDS
tara:strand:+ start:571 stop:789 length:219 start_codon:yes stop_codon:yes gene_type:complete